MTIIERLHFLLLSLGIRLIGLYFLFQAAVALDQMVAYIIYPTPGANSIFYLLVYTGSFVVKTALAAYFLLGAPPALKWIRRFPKPAAPTTNLPPIPAPGE